MDARGLIGMTPGGHLERLSRDGLGRQVIGTPSRRGSEPPMLIEWLLAHQGVGLVGYAELRPRRVQRQGDASAAQSKDSCTSLLRNESRILVGLPIISGRENVAAR